MTTTQLGPAHDLAKRLVNLERAVQQLQSRDVLQNASIGSNGLTVNNSGWITIEGGGSLNVEGGGAAFVNGLRLSAVTAAELSAFASDYAVGTKLSSVATSTVTVPAGYTTALVFATCAAEFASNTAVVAQAAMTLQASSGTVQVSAGSFDQQIAAGATQTLTVALSGIVSGIGTTTPQTITVAGQVAAGTPIPVNAYNAAQVTGLVIFLA